MGVTLMDNTTRFVTRYKLCCIYGFDFGSVEELYSLLRKLTLCYNPLSIELQTFDNKIDNKLICTSTDADALTVCNYCTQRVYNNWVRVEVCSMHKNTNIRYIKQTRPLYASIRSIIKAKLGDMLLLNNKEEL